MRILFDESVPCQLRSLLSGRQIILVEEAGWKGTKNGRLIQLAEDNGFAVLITSDQELKYQQNLKGRKLAVIVLPYNRRRWMPMIVPALNNALDGIRPGAYVEIDRPANLP